MIVIPGLDIKGGKCAYPEGTNGIGAIENPVAAAQAFANEGFRRIHVTDLDAVAGSGTNIASLRELLHDAPIPAQVSANVNNEFQIEQLLDAGATWIVLGNRAIENESWLEEMAESFPERLILHANVRERYVVSNGWTRAIRKEVCSFSEELSTIPLAALLITAVDEMDRSASASEISMIEDVVEVLSLPLMTYGGVLSLEDLRALEHRGASAAVMGSNLYPDLIDFHAVVTEFAE